MAKINLYHGTNADFKMLDPTKSRNLLDFGTGCYLSDNISQAWGMARRKVNIFGGQKRVMEYEFDLDVLNEGFAIYFKDYSVEWTEFIILNRFFSEYDNEYKIIAGPVADGTIPDDIDAYMSQYKEAWRGRDNLEELTKILIFDNNRRSFQYCFRDLDIIREHLKLKEIHYE